MLSVSDHNLTTSLNEWKYTPDHNDSFKALCACWYYTHLSNKYGILKKPHMNIFLGKIQ